MDRGRESSPLLCNCLDLIRGLGRSDLCRWMVVPFGSLQLEQQIGEMNTGTEDED